MFRNKIVCFVIVLGLFRQRFANTTPAAVSTQEKAAIDIKNIQQSDIEFSGQTNSSNCKCPDNVNLNENKPNGKIEYNKLPSKSFFACCMNCVSVISVPLGHQVEVTESSVEFRNDPHASLTIRNGNGNDGYVLGKFVKENWFGVYSSTANAMTVTFSTSASTCGNESYSVSVKLEKLPISFQPAYSLSSDQPFHLITNEDLSSLDKNTCWTVTAETGKQVHLYLYGDSDDYFNIEIYIIDGTDLSGKLISQVTQLSESSNGSLNATSSSGGSLTVLLTRFSRYLPAEINFLFTQLENDPTECGTSELVFISSYNSSAVNVQISNHGAGAASCPAVLITNSQYSSYPGIQLNVSSLQGNMVLYEGVDYMPSSKNEISRFSSMDDVISPMLVAGTIFLVLPSSGSVINLSFQTFPYVPKTSPVLHSLSSNQPFHLIMNKDLNDSDLYCTVTAETGKQVHLYLFGSLRSSYQRKIFVIDGTDVNGKLILEVNNFSDPSNGPLNATSSSGGSLTILLEIGQHPFADANLLFTQLENDPFKCGTSKLVYLTTGISQLEYTNSDSNPAVDVEISNHGPAAASCPAVIINNPQYYLYPRVQLHVSSLQGSMVLYEGVDYRPSSKNEIIRFSSMNEVISPMEVGGRVFLVLLDPGSVINLNFQTSYSHSFTFATGGSGTKGLMMSGIFPYPNTHSNYGEFCFNGSGNNYYKYAINVLHYDLGSTGILIIKSTDPNSFFFSDFSKTLTSGGDNTLMQFCANSFAVNYNLKDVGLKGYILRYDVGETCSRGLSTGLICIIAVAATAVIAVAASLIFSLWKRCKLRSQRNNTNSTVQSVHFASRPNEIIAPSSHIRALKESAPSA